MPDTETLSHVHATDCPHCAAREACVPIEAKLRLLLTEDFNVEREDFTPRAMTQEQAVAAELMTAAIARYWKAFGVELAGTRITALRNTLYLQAKQTRIMARILAARESINARARLAYEVGDVARAHQIEAEPTPDYPERAKDERFLGRAV